MSNITYKWSIEEWHELIETGVLANKPVELLEGDIIKVSPEGVEHTYTNYSISKYLTKLLDELAVVREAHPITLDNSEPEPDLAIVRQPDTTYRNRQPLAKDIYWLIEVSKSTLKVDLEQKAITYARNGIPEYWVIDLVNNKLWVHTQPLEEKYTQIVEYKVGVVSPQAFPDISIAVNKLLLY